MARRSRAREVALQILFQEDWNNAVARPVIERFVQDRLRDKTLEAYCLSLFDGVCRHRKMLDERIQQIAENWRIARMAAIDRNALRMGAFEMLYKTPPTPLAVVINEAIELVRRYGSADSPAFVNGILDKLGKSAKG